MQNMNFYYDFSGQKFGYPLSLSINGFDRQVFSRQSSLELSYVLKGEYEAVCENFSCHLAQHDLLLIAPHDIHMIKGNIGEHIILTIHIDFDRISESMIGHVEHAFESMLCNQSKNSKLYLVLKKKMGELLSVLLYEEHHMLHLNAIMMEIIYLASNHTLYPVERLPLQSDQQENYMKAIRFLDQHFEDDLRLEDVAHTLSFSISYTSRLFKKYTGLSFVTYLSNIRLRASLEALLEGKDSIEQIAAACGMPNSKAYTVAFKELYGITPSVYRKQFKQDMKLNERHEQQSMKLDEQQIMLIEHLISESQHVLYENAGMKISYEENHIQCRIQIDEHTKTKIIQEENQLYIDVTKSF